jgi:hypothetical protein
MSASVSPACQNDLVLLLQGGTLAGLSDSQLLDQFLTRRDAAGDAVGVPICRRNAQNSAALNTASVDRVRCLRPLLGSRA